MFNGLTAASRQRIPCTGVGRGQGTRQLLPLSETDGRVARCEDGGGGGGITGPSSGHRSCHFPTSPHRGKIDSLAAPEMSTRGSRFPEETNVLQAEACGKAFSHDCMALAQCDDDDDASHALPRNGDERETNCRTRVHADSQRNPAASQKKKKIKGDVVIKLGAPQIERL